MNEFELSPLMAQFAKAATASHAAGLAESLAEPPPLSAYLDRLQPDATLDWSGTSFWGMPELRARILTAYDYPTAEPEWDMERVLVTAGTSEAIFLAMAQTLQPGDEAIIETPGWPQPMQVAPGLGARVVAWPRVEAAGWALDLERLETLISPRTKLIYFSNPNNPTGHITQADALAQLVGIARRHGITVLSDEVYRGLEWGDAKETTTPRLAAHYERGISVGSVSKLFGLQGIRIGWMISQERTLLERAYRQRANSSALLNVLGERIANAALAPEHFHIARTRQRALGRAALNSLDKIITSTERLSWHKPRGGFLGFARSHEATGDALAAALLADPYRLWIIPGTVYGYPQHIRLGLGGNPRNVEDGLTRLAAFLDVPAVTAGLEAGDPSRAQQTD